MRALPSASIASVLAASRMLSSRQSGVRKRRWSSAWRTRSLCASGCSSIVSPIVSSAVSAAPCVGSSSVYEQFVSALSVASGPRAARTARTHATSRPGSIFSLMRGYPSAKAARARLASASGVACIPREIPTVCRSCLGHALAPGLVPIRIGELGEQNASDLDHAAGGAERLDEGKANLAQAEAREPDRHDRGGMSRGT